MLIRTGQKKTAFRRTVGLCCALGLAITACGGDDSADRDDVIAWLVDQGESTEVANCFADELSDYKASDFETLKASEGEGDVDLEFLAAVGGAAGVCSDK